MRRFRHAYLLAALALVAFGRAFIAEQVLGLAIVDVLLLVTLLAGAYAAVDQKKLFGPVVVLGLVSAGAQIVFAATRSSSATGVFLVATLLFYGAVAWALLRSLFNHQRSVTRDTLYQAVSVYLLLGLIGAAAYALLELAAPGSFGFRDGSPGGEARFDRFLGFSFTTLTTLGYGNIAPATPRADAVSTLQAVVGQIYLAVVIARLVAIHVGQGGGGRGNG